MKDVQDLGAVPNASTISTGSQGLLFGSASKNVTLIQLGLVGVLMMGAKQDRLAWNREVENCRMTPLLVKILNANDNFAPMALAA